MSGLKDMAKGGWHPKGNDGKSKESWRGDFKGINQVAGWVGKGKNGSANAEAHEHVSQPLSALKDPAAFGPPPKHVDLYEGHGSTAGSTGGRESADESQTQMKAEEAAKPKPPPAPYRVDTTGLSTANIPPPPGRKVGEEALASPKTDKRKPPGLPPRLPPRQDSNPTSSSPPPSSVDPHKGILNQGSLSRLGAAGISVPGLTIGESKGKPPLPPPPLGASSQRTSATPPQENTSQLNNLQSRFSRLSPAPSKPESPSEGTSFAQKKAALKTAGAFRDDPSSISLGDAKAAASTANNFGERHGDQVASGWQSANKLNNKYGVADRLGGLDGTKSTPTPPPRLPLEKQETITRTHGANKPPEVAGLAKKKPPPPPAKKPELASPGVSKEAHPPPIPISSKPKPPVS